MDGFELDGVELGVDLLNPELKKLKIEREEFISILVPDYTGARPLENYGSGFRVEADGVYLCKIPEALLGSLTDAEYRTLLEHPRGKSKEPVLAFPFSLRDLSVFLDWAQSVGHDFPINEVALESVIEAQRKCLPSDQFESDSESDRALGVYYRERNRSFANKNHERSDARAMEHARWTECAFQIIKRRQKRPSIRELSRLVKEELGLEDAIDTIRKALAKYLPKDCR